MGDVVQLRPTQQEVPIRLVDPDEVEHVCSRQARILNAWLIDSTDTAGIDWVIARLEQAKLWASAKKLFQR